MNTKGVEDGITDAFNEGVKAAAKVFECAGMIHNEVYALLKPSAAVPVANLAELLRNVRSATPEELTAQAESRGANYKPGPRQDTPFMPTLPVPERTTLPTREAVETALAIHDYPAKTIKWHLALLPPNPPCKYCGGPADHKCGQFNACGDCCGNHGELTRLDKRLYQWVRETSNAHGRALASLAQSEAERERLTEEMYEEMRALIYDVQYLTFIGHPALDTCEEFKKKLGSRAEALIEVIKEKSRG